MGKFQKVLKSASSRDAIAEAIAKKAQKVAKREGISRDLAEALTWAKHPEAADAYEAAKKADKPKPPERRVAQMTSAEAELDNRARKIMCKNRRLTYAGACTKALTDDPSLYAAYEKEIANAAVYSVPEPAEYLDVPTRYSKSGNDLTCPECDAEVDADDSYCASCGAKLTKRRPAA